MTTVFYESPTVYVVTSGCYSEYSIRAVFLDKAAAEKFTELANRTADYRTYSIEEWPVGGGHTHGALPLWEFTADDWNDWEIECEPIGRDEPVADGLEVDEHGGRIEVIAADYDRGLKVMHDKIAHAKATKAGIA